MTESAPFTQPRLFYTPEMGSRLSHRDGGAAEAAAVGLASTLACRGNGG